MTKAFIVPIIFIVAVAVPTMFGFIPAVIGVAAMLLIAVLKDVIMMVLLRGLPMAMASCRMQGGMLWGVVKRNKTILAGRINPSAGMTSTEKHGRFTLVGSQTYNLDGIPIGFAPEDVGYNVGFEHVALVNILKARGINDITEVCDVDEFGYFKNWKDDERIRDLKEDDETIKALREKYGPTPGSPMDLSGFGDFHRYTQQASNPYHQDVNVKQGIAQGLGRSEKGVNTGLWVVVGVIIGAVLVLGVSFLLGGKGGEQVVRVVTDNAGSGTTVIPV